MVLHRGFAARQSTWTCPASTTAGGSLTATSYTGTFTFVAADLVGSPNTTALVVRRFVGPTTWTAGLVPLSTPTTATGGFTTLFGDFAAGE